MNFDPKSSKSGQNHQNFTPFNTKRCLSCFKTDSEMSEKPWFRGFLRIFYTTLPLQKSRKITNLLTVINALQKHWFSASERSRATVKYILASDAKIHEFGPKIIQIRTKSSKCRAFWHKALTKLLQNGVRNERKSVISWIFADFSRYHPYKNHEKSQFCSP